MSLGVVPPRWAVCMVSQRPALGSRASDPRGKTSPRRRTQRRRLISGKGSRVVRSDRTHRSVPRSIHPRLASPLPLGSAAFQSRERAQGGKHVGALAGTTPGREARHGKSAAIDVGGRGLAQGERAWARSVAARGRESALVARGSCHRTPHGDRPGTHRLGLRAATVNSRSGRPFWYLFLPATTRRTCS
jgi:hypothetical protein